MKSRFFNIGGTVRKIAVSLARPITKEMAEEIAVKSGEISVAHNSRDNKYLLIDSHGKPDLLEHHGGIDNWTVGSIKFPLLVLPREGLEDGIVDTIDKFLFVFHRGETQLKLDIDFYHKSIPSKVFLEWYADYMFTDYLNPNITLGFRFSQEFIMPVNYKLEEEKDDLKAFMYILGNYINDIGIE